MSHSDISNALSKRLQSLPDAPPIAFENAPFTTSEGETFLAENFLPGETTGVGVSGSDSLDYVGVYQVDVRTPLDEYKVEANALADSVISHFKRGTVMTFDGQSVVVESATRGNGRADSGWWFVPVTINWRAFSGNV